VRKVLRRFRVLWWLEQKRKKQPEEDNAYGGIPEAQRMPAAARPDWLEGKCLGSQGTQMKERKKHKV
jgi:hypothetical protein